VHFAQHAEALFANIAAVRETLSQAVASAAWTALRAVYPALVEARRAARLDATYRTRARVGFRGAGLVMLDTLEEPSRRITLRFETSDLPPVSEVELRGRWVVSDRIHRLVAGDSTIEFDEQGQRLHQALPVAHLAAAVRDLSVLDRHPQAMSTLIGAGLEALPALIAHVLPSPDHAQHCGRIAVVEAGLRLLRRAD
jgi:hypothetical protein